MEDIWNNFKEVVSESIKHFVPYKILRKNKDPEYYSKDFKRLKIKVRKAYNRRKIRRAPPRGIGTTIQAVA